PPDQAWQAEDILERLASDQPPHPPAGKNDFTSVKHRQAWFSWWQKNRDQVDLARLDSPGRLLGYTLLVETDMNNNTGRIRETAAGGKVRWELTGLHFPTDAQV